jgi:hypothetical protein
VTLLSEQEFEARLPRLTAALQKMLLLAFPALDSRVANDMAQHARYWNYRTFEQKIRRMGRRLHVEMRSDDLRPVIDTRNELVHRMRFLQEGQEWEEFARTLLVLDRVLMGLLGYRGPYVNPVTIKRVDIEAPTDGTG